MAKNIPEEWSENLTPELRAHFESVGRELVEFDVGNKKYSTRGKHFAALAWLAEQRQEDGQKETVRFRLILTVAVLTLLVALLGVAVTVAVTKGVL